MAIIEFINGRNKTYTGLRRAIDYILRDDKTAFSLYGGFNCDVDNALNEFVMTKRHYNKETGRQYIHFVQSFSNREGISPETAKAIADELLLMDKFKGFQMVYATHTDKPHLHTHFILNTVNSYTGMKWKMSKEDLQELKDYSDEICRRYGLIVTHGKKGSHIDRGEYRTMEKGHSWKHELFLAVSEAKRYAISREDFIDKLKQLGYQTEWSDNRKYITFTNIDGKKCRNRKLYPPERFTKEALEQRFELNAVKLDKQVSKAKFEGLLSAIKLFETDGGMGMDHKNTYPLSQMENAAGADDILNAKQNTGLNWEKESGHEM
ncbi:relaxase/mobilization nuclease domain-containing protein [Alkaliphilus pronyensis]|uniref:Relaxase/mobilization nuclease domain-containing protein n=1 Tax=Alkaliphilus pronyensis TaxID=1482732 RepID=A0A6I0F8E4_9FIRM|nr:relaxase/mobilization nuclease domain-containing protein [Alkaliphilus pronyensis]KAB3536239.1 relaxase/mobilization nuclease domain-containing protein [Alkaliphilus pronyensis]